jgi:Xaa-Pro aminopeptidase
MDFVRQETFLDVDKIEAPAGLQDALDALRRMGAGYGKLGLELDAVSAQLYLKMEAVFKDHRLVDISKDVLNQRMVKDEMEIDHIRQACRIMDAGHRRVIETLHPGMTELQLAAEVEYAHRRAGHEGVLSMRNFDFYISRGPLSSGDNLFKVSGFANTITGVGLSPAIPAGPSMRKINAKDLVVVDIPTCYRGYHCDQTRTYCIGAASEAVKSLYGKLSDIYQQALSTLRSGITCRELFASVHDEAIRLGVADGFLGLPPRKANFVGHGIGLDANEPPTLFGHSDFVLGQGFVLTLEIHLTHPQHGAVKLEDVVLVEEVGCRVLTITPMTLFEV